MRHSLDTVDDWTCEVISRVCFVFCASAVVGGVIKSSGRERDERIGRKCEEIWRNNERVRVRVIFENTGRVIEKIGRKLRKWKATLNK